MSGSKPVLGAKATVNNHIINNFRHKVKESQTKYTKKARLIGLLVNHILATL